LFEKELLNKLKDDKILYNLRNDQFNFKIKIKKLIIFTQNTLAEIQNLNAKTEIPLSNDFICNDNWQDYLDIIFKEKLNIEKKYIDVIDSIFDGSSIFSKKNKKKIELEPKNMNDFIKKSLDLTFKLDSTQRQIALQIPNGPQRIRGFSRYRKNNYSLHESCISP
jgi:superfamily I DNA and RNA helicase